MTSHLIQGKLWILDCNFPFSPSTLLTKCKLQQKVGWTVRVEINSGRGQNWRSFVFWLNTQSTALVGNKNNKVVKTKKREIFHETNIIFQATLNLYCTSYNFADNMGFKHCHDRLYTIYMHIWKPSLLWRAWNAET